VLGFRPDRGLEAAADVARWMGRELGWPEARAREEVGAYRGRVMAHSRPGE
jgi:hypothetical protein